MPENHSPLVRGAAVHLTASYLDRAKTKLEITGMNITAKRSLIWQPSQKKRPPYWREPIFGGRS